PRPTLFPYTTLFRSFTATAAGDAETATPIKHVIVLLGENRTFDHIFGTFEPNAGQTIVNLLSQGIMNADGSPGPNYARAAQWEEIGRASCRERGAML